MKHGVGVEVITTIQLNAAEAEVLQQLHGNGGLSARDMKPGDVSICNRFVRFGLVERHKDPGHPDFYGTTATGLEVLRGSGL